jgi:hypothetical protein
MCLCMDAKREYAKGKRGMPYNFSLVAFLECENDSMGLFGMWFDAALWHVLRVSLVVAII